MTKFVITITEVPDGVEASELFKDNKLKENEMRLEHLSYEQVDVPLDVLASYIFKVCQPDVLMKKLIVWSPLTKSESPEDGPAKESFEKSHDILDEVRRIVKDEINEESKRIREEVRRIASEEFSRQDNKNTNPSNIMSKCTGLDQNGLPIFAGQPPPHNNPFPYGYNPPMQNPFPPQQYPVNPYRQY